jgi:hypothetical protein
MCEAASTEHPSNTNEHDNLPGCAEGSRQVLSANGQLNNLGMNRQALARDEKVLGVGRLDTY